MIRTSITPVKNNQSLILNFPDEYLGEELEILVFKKTEGISDPLPKATMLDFWNTISDESAEKLHASVINIRNE
jgi:hypothetical protein